MGGKTENASQVKKTIFLGWAQTAGIFAFSTNSKGYEALVFYVIETSL